MALGGPEDKGRSGNTGCWPFSDVLGFVLSISVVSADCTEFIAGTFVGLLSRDVVQSLRSGHAGKLCDLGCPLSYVVFWKGAPKKVAETMNRT